MSEALHRRGASTSFCKESDLDGSAVNLPKGETEGKSCSRSKKHSQGHGAGCAVGWNGWQKPRNTEHTGRVALQKPQGFSPLKPSP